MHLKNAKGEPQKGGADAVLERPFCFPRQAQAEAAHGKLHVRARAGPEYIDRKGYFTIEDNADDEQVIELKRSVNMADEGWWSGDLHIHRSEKDIRLLMEAEDLHVAPLITWWNEKTPGRESDCPRSRSCASTRIASTICSAARTNVAAGPCFSSTWRRRWKSPARSANIRRR